MSVEKWEEGWGEVSGSRKKHYFKDGKSLCGPYFTAGTFRLDPELPADMEKDKCPKCKRELEKATF